MTPETTYQQSRWSLDDLFPGAQSPELAAAFGDLEKMTADFETLRPQLTPQIDDAAFMDVVHKLDAINYLAHKLYGFAELWVTEDTQNQAALGLVARVQQFVAELSNRLLFFDLWWKDLDDVPANRLMNASGDYRYWLEAMRYFKPHTLSEPEEKIINLKNVTGAEALNTLYETITNRYTFKITIDGKEKEMTRGELMTYPRKADPNLRAAAYQELYRVYGNDGLILGQIYQTLARDWRNEQINLRKYASPIATRNLVNDIPDAVIETLLDVAQKNAGVFQRFFKIKAKRLGMERLRRYDIYAPTVQSEKAYPFGEAAAMVLDSFHQFEPRFGELAERVFKQNRLDSEVRKGKRSGAFCATAAHDRTPWVMLNYQGRADDVSTMAHELGHAIHSMLAQHHTTFTAHACLPLAETASTFGEMMLVDRLLAQESDADVRRDLLFGQVDDAYATIIRQAFFALFERQAHEMIHAGASVDDLSDAYLINLKTQFGDAVEISDEFRWEWVSIPHIYNVPFYVYAYAFGQLLVLSLYQQYKQEGDSFKPRYMELLAAGGSAAPMKVLANAGIDAAQPSFWQGGFDVVANLVSQLEALP
ncbi:MAG: M3 family oligoendopeptidase [Anaerolineae bacterium]|nr:M3 family oligoendopeptidase [Anaerolineae bacterium]